MEGRKMSKSSLSVLAKAVASKRGLTQAEAERFIATMFEVAGDGIQEDKLLKMKWLGTFKITSVKDRESVDVNTGERILIEGRDKISFTPDNILKEIINKPFAQFETVVVNDGIDFSDIDEKFANMEREEEELQLQKEQECHDEEVVQEEQNAELPQKEDLSQEEEQPREEDLSQEVELNEDLSQEAKKSQESLLDAELQSQEGGQKDELSQEVNTPISEETVALSSELKNAEIPEDDISETSEDNISQTSDDTISKTEENGIPEEVGILISHLKENESEAEEIERVEEAKVKEEAEVPKAAEAHVEKTPEEAKVVVSQSNVENKKQPEYDETLDKDEAYASSDRHHFVIPKYVVALVSVVFVALLGGLCWFAFIYGKMQARQEQMEMQLKAIKPQPQPKPKPTVVAPVDTAKSVASSDDKTDAENVLANGAQANNEQTDHAQLAMKKKAKQDSIRMAQANNAVKMAEKASVYLNDPRIRTGAYRIVGVEKTVTAKSGQTLAGLSKLYLGPGMECYMQAINGCSEIKPGQKVKIPKLELKRKGKKN